MYFRKSLFKIDGGDFALIANAMGVPPEFGSQFKSQQSKSEP
jgi:hypothetical protein